MSQIINLFPLSIYKSKIDCSTSSKDEMIKEIFDMEKKSKNLEFKKKIYHGQVIPKDMNI
tara:strand:- start:281 stop:460 length:180 start_codon:yes stop_codon:yes gene_type:complete